MDDGWDTRAENCQQHRRHLRYLKSPKFHYSIKKIEGYKYDYVRLWAGIMTISNVREDSARLALLSDVAADTSISVPAVYLHARFHPWRERARALCPRPPRRRRRRCYYIDKIIGELSKRRGNNYEHVSRRRVASRSSLQASTSVATRTSHEPRTRRRLSKQVHWKRRSGKSRRIRMQRWKTQEHVLWKASFGVKV